MTEAMGTPTAADTRYHIKNGQAVLVVLHTDAHGTRKTVKAQLVHVSPRDASLRTKAPIEAKEIVGLTLTAKQPERMISVSGEVCWVVPGSGKRWWVGCSFDPPIPVETLEQFAEGGVLERRQHMRQAVSLSAAAKWELDSDAISAKIVDFSQGGFCLQSPVEGKPGERLLLQFGSHDGRELLVPAKAQWQVESHGQFVVGCQFVDPDGYRVFNEAVDLGDLTVEGAFSVWRWLGGA